MVFYDKISPELVSVCKPKGRQRGNNQSHSPERAKRFLSLQGVAAAGRKLNTTLPIFQLIQIFLRVLPLNQCAFGGVKPIIQPRNQKAHAGAAVEGV